MTPILAGKRPHLFFWTAFDLALCPLDIFGQAAGVGVAHGQSTLRAEGEL